jgi:hypothetical protein
VQSRCAFANSEPPPFSARRAPGRTHSFVHLSFVGLGDLRDHRSVRRIHIRELALPGHESAINVILD